MHHDTYKHFPTNGWGWQWVDAADRGYDQKQPGGWTYNILAYLEQQAARNLATGGASTAELLQAPIDVYHCPSRRGKRLYPVGPGLPALVNSDAVTEAAKK